MQPENPRPGKELKPLMAVTVLLYFSRRGHFAVRVEINFDPSYNSGPEHPMPRWFKKQLADNPQALKN
jgi:hypothetical protein